MDGPISYGGGRTAIRDDLGVPVVVVNSEFETLALHLAGAVDSGGSVIGRWPVRRMGSPGCPISRTAAAGGRTPCGSSPWPSRPFVMFVGGWPKDDLRRRFPVSRWTRAAAAHPARRRLRECRRRHPPSGTRAPVAEYRGTAVGTGLPPLFGAARPFTDDELKTLYPSRRLLEARWQSAVVDLVASEAIRPADAATIDPKDRRRSVAHR